MMWIIAILIIILTLSILKDTHVEVITGTVVLLSCKKNMML